MIEELNEYLMRHGMDEAIANDIHDAFVNGGVYGVREWAEGEFVEGIIQKVEDWQKEVGEV